MVKSDIDTLASKMCKVNGAVQLCVSVKVWYAGCGIDDVIEHAQRTGYQGLDSPTVTTNYSVFQVPCNVEQPVVQNNEVE